MNFKQFENHFQKITISDNSGLVAQWITRLPTEQKIAGSSPAEVENPFLKTTIQGLKY